MDTSAESDPTVTIGFTGTQNGMTDAQQASVALFLARYKSFIGVHGACIGADDQFDVLARHSPGFRGMFLHPSNIKGKQGLSMTPLSDIDVVLTPKPPLVRNRLIAIHCNLLLATPKEDHMVMRSGTWSTVRYAFQEQKPVYVIVPNGALIRWEPVT